MPVTISPQHVANCLSSRVRLYRWRPPVYQQALIADLADLWSDHHRKVLDVGGGTGLMAQVVKELFPVESVTSIDVEQRFLPGLTIETALFDGIHLPFANDTFDCVTLINVLHHVPPKGRLALLRECRRVAGSGPIYVKDHTSTTAIDDLRLFALDAMGNLPFSGMVRARYLSSGDWSELADASGYDIVAHSPSAYRGVLMGALFPNRLETTMRWTPRPNAISSPRGAAAPAARSGDASLDRSAGPRP